MDMEIQMMPAASEVEDVVESLGLMFAKREGINPEEAIPLMRLAIAQMDVVFYRGGDGKVWLGYVS
jgi:hypothetical protein